MRRTKKATYPALYGLDAFTRPWLRSSAALLRNV